ncbi:MAG: LPS export ABC transporter periplasmic protein LptC [Chthoniobacterales bacterium]|nr:LPS export ABC transporter periplasmic protein LptC [Chthoniobacterales bacterium]
MKNIPLTVGHEAKGLVLPNYDLKGHLLGRFEAATASRLDEDHVHFTNLKMTTFDDHEKPDFNIDMTEGVLNLETRVITSKARTKIKRTDFEIAGDAMQFSTLTHQGTLTGNVHMTVFKQSQLTGKAK